MESQVTDQFNSRRSEVIMNFFKERNDSLSSLFRSLFNGVCLGMKMLSDLLVSNLLSQDQSDEMEELGLRIYAIFQNSTTVVIISEKYGLGASFAIS